MYMCIYVYMVQIKVDSVDCYIGFWSFFPSKPHALVLLVCVCVNVYGVREQTGCNDTLGNYFCPVVFHQQLLTALMYVTVKLG